MINDFGTERRSTLRKFADNAKWRDIVNTGGGWTIAEDEQDDLKHWSSIIGMKLNSTKCRSRRPGSGAGSGAAGSGGKRRRVEDAAPREGLLILQDQHHPCPTLGLGCGGSLVLKGEGLSWIEEHTTIYRHLDNHSIT